MRDLEEMQNEIEVKLIDKSERERVVIELTIRRVEMLLLKTLGLGYIELINDISEQIRMECGLS